MKLIDKLKKGMQNWIFDTEEQAIEEYRKYLTTTPFGITLSGEFIDAIVSLSGDKPKKKAVIPSELDSVVQEIREAIVEVVGGHIKTTKSGRYTVTTFGEQGKKILGEWINTNPDELSSLIEAIKCYYRDVDVPKAINNFFIEGLHKNYKDFLQDDKSVSMLRL